MPKLSQDVQLYLAHQFSRKKWNIEEVLDVLKAEVEAREASQVIKTSVGTHKGIYSYCCFTLHWVSCPSVCIL